MKIDVVLDAHAGIGESPTWVAAENALYWMDVRKPAVYRYDPASGAERCWPVTSHIGAFALLADLSGAVVALREGVHRLDFASGSLERLAPPPFDPALFRFNEGACDSTGRFWIGAMFEPLDKDSTAAPQKCALHTFTFATGLRPVADTSALHNGMAWSPDERLFYISHTQTREILAYPFDAQRGELGARSLFAQIPEAVGGVPDGAAMDSDGGYWCALHGAGRLRRHHANGTVDRDIALPVSQPTMCAFGGPSLDTLYVTSSAEDLSPQQLRDEPHAGALLSLRPGETGIVKPCVVR